VDDEPNVLEGLTRVLSEQFEVVTSTNPLEALSLLERDGNFAVVISDVNMPQMNGLTFLRQVQAISPTTTRLALTGALIVNPYGLPPDAVFRIIAKPCPPAVLTELVLDAYHYHALMASSPMQPLEPALESCAARGPRAPASPVITIRASAEAGEALALPSRVGLRMTARTIELLPGVTLLGRSRTCHVPVDDPKISRRHACFANGNGKLTVRNLSSTSRLLLNGLPVEGEEPRQLQVGDQAFGGVVEVQLREFDEAAEAVAEGVGVNVDGVRCGGDVAEIVEVGAQGLDVGRLLLGVEGGEERDLAFAQLRLAGRRVL